ncbi:band 4.1-like protein 4 [Polymixia lowei]
MSCFRGTGEEFYCEVLLLDDTKIALTAEQGIKISTKGAAILHLVFDHIDLVEIDYFGLRYCDHHHRTHWLDPSKSLSQHRDLISTGPPYTLYFGVKFYAEDPCRLKEEITRYLFFLQVRQDVQQGRLPCPPDIAARLTALALQCKILLRHKEMCQPKQEEDCAFDFPGTKLNLVTQLLTICAELGDYAANQSVALEDDVQEIYKTLTGLSPSEAERLYLSIARALDMYGLDLHPVFGENHSEYFLGLTPVGVVIYKNKTQVGKYFWPRITKVHFKDTQFELSVVGKDGGETLFAFGALDRKACKHLWRSCVQHHSFFRMPSVNEADSLSRRLSKLGSLGSRHRYSGRTASRLKRVERDIVLPRDNVTIVRIPSKTHPKKTLNTDVTNQSQSDDGTVKFTAPAPIKSSEPDIREEEHHGKPSAPWEDNGPKSGLFNTCSDRTRSPKFPVSRVRTPLGDGREEGEDGGKRRRRSQGDSERPIRQHRRRSRSRGNTSSGSESENSSGAQERHKKKNRCRHDNQLVDSAPQWEAVQRRQRERAQSDPNLRRHRHRSRSQSPDVQAKEQLWKHIQRELVDPEGLSEEQLREIPYKKVETLGDPIRMRHAHSPRSLRLHCLTSNPNSNVLVPPLPITRTADNTSQQKSSNSSTSLSANQTPASRNPTVKGSIPSQRADPSTCP